MNDDLDLLEADIGPLLRRTLHAAADVGVPAEGTLRRRSVRRIVAGGIAGAVAVTAFAAWNGHDPGEIERVPVETALMSGAAEGGHWWLLPSVHERCGVANPGVEFVAEATNKPGLEWNTGGVEYGEQSHSDNECDQHRDESAWLNDPTLAALGFMGIGFERDDSGWGFFGAFHPDVAAIEVSIDGGEPFIVRTVPTPDRIDGPRYAAFAVPSAASTVRTRFVDADRRPIPGSTTVRQMPTRR